MQEIQPAPKKYNKRAYTESDRWVVWGAPKVLILIKTRSLALRPPFNSFTYPS